MLLALHKMGQSIAQTYPPQQHVAELLRLLELAVLHCLPRAKIKGRLEDRGRRHQYSRGANCFVFGFLP